jgi:surface-anchored protein
MTLRTFRSSVASLAVAVSLAFAASAARAEPIILSSGHTDIFEAEYELHEGVPELHLGVHSGEDPGTHYEPGDVILQVKNSAYASTSGLPTAITEILGANAWILPADLEQAAVLGVLEAGVKRVGFPNTNPVTYTMLSAGASNPGNFALYSSTNVLRLSATGSAVGTSSFSTSTGHVHYNWGFSAPGIYEFTMQASYTDPVEGPLLSPAEVYTFQVVPEPSTWAMAGAAAIGVILLGRRRR